MSTRPPLTAPDRADRRFGVRAALVFVAVLLVAIPFSLLIVLVTAKTDFLLNADRATTDTLHGFALDHPGFIDGMKLVSTVASATGWIVVLVVVLGWLLYRRLFRLAAFVVVTSVGSSILNSVLKTAVDRARPVLLHPVASAPGRSFPSGHAQSATVGVGILILVFAPVVAREHRRWMYAAGLFVMLLVGFSRIALGVHFLSDVLGGYVIGTAWVLAMTAAFSAWRRERNRAPVKPEEGLEPEHGDRLMPGRGDDPTSAGRRLG